LGQFVGSRYFVVVAGTKGGIHLPEMEIYSTLGRYQADFKPRLFDEGKYSDRIFSGHYNLIEDYLAYLNGTGPIPIKSEETLNVAAVIDAFYLSAAEGREVRAAEVCA
jgi:predicted dehydrogenase